MRLGIDLSDVTDQRELTELATEADRLGLWAVLIGGPAGTETMAAAAIAVCTDSIHLAVLVDGDAEHPLTIAEEISVLDHLSKRRALAIVNGEPGRVDHIARLLAGEIVDDVALSPPPAQTVVPVWAAAGVARTTLSGDLERDAATIEQLRDSGCTHLFVVGTGATATVARHLASRAAGPDFPSIVAEMADRISPL